MAAPKSAEPLPGAGLGRIAYEAHVAATGEKSPKPFDELPRDVAAAWCAAGHAVISATFSRSA